MQIRHLEYFVALAEHRHFARAAESCHVTQPTLSEGVRALERELGIQLVHRGRSFEGLTPEGARVLVLARRILADDAALTQEVAALRSGLSGRLRLGVIPAAASTAAFVTAPFGSDHPMVGIALENGLQSEDIRDRVRRGDLDAGIAYSQSAEHDLRELLLYTDQQVLIAGESLIQDGDEVRGWSDAAALPMCLLSRGMHGRRLVDDALAAQGLAVSPQIESDSVASIMAHVSTGRWAGIVPLGWLRTMRPATPVRLVPLPRLSGQDVVLVTRRTHPTPPLVQALTDTAASVGVAGDLST